MGFQFYATDTQLHLFFDSHGGEVEASVVSQIEACTCEIDKWMCC